MSRLGTLFIAAICSGRDTGLGSRTVNVAPGGLAEALDTAFPGDTLVLAPGIHPGPVSIATRSRWKVSRAPSSTAAARQSAVTVEAPA